MTYDLYTSTLVIGAAGLGIMAFGGLGRHGAGHHAAAHHAGGHHGAAHHAHGDGTHSGHMHRALWAFTSPRMLFSVLLGFGTSGILLRTLLPESLLVVTALLGGIIFERAIVSPLWSATMRFASEPAATLESSVTDTATAVTSFDANGQGIVALEVDGQMVQVLGTLQHTDRELGVSVRAGERLRIEAVDAERNRCTVSRQ